jgi:hypothetical protein
MGLNCLHNVTVLRAISNSCVVLHEQKHPLLIALILRLAPPMPRAERESEMFYGPST